MRILWKLIRCIVGTISFLIVLIYLAEFFQGGNFFQGKGTTVFFVALAILIFLLFTSNTSLIQCPNCNSGDVELESTKEIDRWIGKTKVREKMASGKIRERYMQATMVKKRYYYCCRKCNHKFTLVREQEL